MLKIILSSSFIIFLITNSYSQTKPENYFIQGEKKFLSKTTAQNPASNSITDIITTGDTVWLATSRGVSVSFDRGENWTNFYGTPPFGEDGVSAIGYNNGTVWAATVTSVAVPGGSGTVPKGTGIKFTTNNGESWTSRPQPLDNSGDSVIVHGTFGQNRFRVLPVTVAEQNVTYDITFTPNTVWVTSFAGGLRKSTNMGQTWERVLLPTDSLNSISPDDTVRGINLCISPAAGSFCGHDGWLNYRAFSIITTNDSTLYVGTANGINKSTDNGISWRKLNHQNQTNSISGNFVVALGHNQFNNTVWGATWRAEDNQEFYAVSYSSDGGENWNTTLEDERAHNFGFNANGDVIAPSDNGAFRASTPYSVWILPNSIVDRNLLRLTTNIFYSAVSQDNDIWLGSADGLIKNTNSLNNWSDSWRIYFASQPLASKRETYAFPNPFSPRSEVIDLKYSTGGKRSNVTIRIFDFAMNYVRTVVQNVERGDPLHEIDNFDLETNGVIDSWDGRDENGNIVPNGVYFYRVEFDNEDPVFGKIIVLQ